MKTASEAIACPFCGSLKVTIEWEPCEPLDRTDTNRRWFAECCGCSCQGPFCQKENEVIPAWNKRADASLSAYEKGIRDAAALVKNRNAPEDCQTCLAVAREAILSLLSKPKDKE